MISKRVRQQFFAVMPKKLISFAYLPFGDHALQTLRLPLLVGLLLTFQVAAHAGTLIVKVFRPNGGAVTEVVGANVCVATGSGTPLFNTTNVGATAGFANVPQVQLTITVSAAGLIGQSKQISMTASDRTEVFTLVPGSGGPVCTPPPITPRDNVANETTLVVQTFKLNDGADSTKSRLVSLRFTARELNGSYFVRDATLDVTHYRVRESPDSKPADLSGQPWIPLEHALIQELALHNGFGRRYGERRVMFQVKTATLTSDVVSDTILLEPVLKEYRVSASGNTHPLIQYAASQGFTFSRSFYEACPHVNSCGQQPDDTDISSGSAAISAASNCTVKSDFQLFFDRSPNTFWRIKSLELSGAHLVTHGPNRYLAKFTTSAIGSADCPPCTTLSGGTCFLQPGQFFVTVGDVVVEGPEVDDFVDPANPWKNAFVRPTLNPIFIRPVIPGT